MTVTSDIMQMLAAVCGDQTLVSIFRGCHTQPELDKKWAMYEDTVQKLTKNWQEKAGIVSGIERTDYIIGAKEVRSMDAILQDFIDSVRCIAASLTIAELSAWLNNEEGSPSVLGIKEHFRELYAKDPEEALDYLKQQQVEVLISGKWV